MVSLALVVAILAAGAMGQALDDPPVLGGVSLELKNWTLSSGPTFKAFDVLVPGDLASDIARHFLHEIELLQNSNWLTYAHLIWEREWVYQSNFSVSAESGETFLVLDGIKMGAIVAVNGVTVTKAPNQFLRYQLNISSLVSSSSSSNLITITFPAINNGSTGIETDGRYMACSGGWDWAPYNSYNDTRGERVGSRGIWKRVAIVSYKILLVESVVPVVYHRGEQVFALNLTVHYRSHQTISLSVETGWSSKIETLELSNSDGVLSQATLILEGIQVEHLWSPGKLNKESLYSLRVKSDDSDFDYSTRVGFRSVALVTTKSSMQRNEHDGSSGNFTMRFVVNGRNMILRGANFIPSTIFEGRISGADLRATVAAAAKVGMNVIRVWGGGVYQYEDFYEAADEFGILLLHDMMLSSSAFLNSIPPPPQHCQSLIDEIQYQIRRLATHPSIISYNGCNECELTPEYMQVFEPLIANDRSRIVWPSSPSAGWDNGVDEFGLPNGQSLIPRVPPSLYNSSIEHHGPYLHGTGWPSINDLSGILVPFAPLTPPPLLSSSAVGLSERGAFISEYECVAMSSDFSMNVTLAEEERSLHSKQMLQRNYPCDNLIDAYFGNVSSSLARWSLNLYACNMAQMLHMSGQIAIFRAGNSFGVQTWQLNEIWPTGGWGSVETAKGSNPPLSGQIAGGRFKPLMYAFPWLNSPHFVGCGSDAKCYLRRDVHGNESESFQLSLIDAGSNGKRHFLRNVSNVAVESFGIGEFCASGAALDDCSTWASIAAEFGAQVNNSLIVVVASSGSSVYLPLGPPRNMQLPKATILTEWHEETLVLTSSDFAAWVYVTADGCQPVDNNFFLFPNAPLNVAWQGPCDFDLARTTLRIQHAQQYLSL